MTAGEKSGVQDAHHVVRRLRVTGGFLGGVSLEFADGLNCLIGGRGAGKTTALELLRFGLGLMPDSKASPTRHRAIEGLVRANLAGGRVCIDLRTKTGMLYTAERSHTENVQVSNEAGAAVPISLDRDHIFSADVFSQNEIEEIAQNPAAQLALLDRFEEESSAAIARDLEQLRRELEQSAADLQRIDRDIGDLRAKASEKAVLEEKLRGLAEVSGPDAERLNVAHAGKTVRVRELGAVASLSGALDRVARDVAASVAAFEATTDVAIDEAIRKGANKELFEAIGGRVDAFRASLRNAHATIAAEARLTARSVLESATSLTERHATQEGEYRALVSISQEYGSRAAERNELQTQLGGATIAAAELDAKRTQRGALEAARAGLLNRLSERRDDRFALRKRVADALSARFRTIRVSVSQGSELQPYRDVVGEALKGAGFKQNILAERLAEGLLPTELARAVVADDYATVAQRAGVDDDKARRVVVALRADGAAYGIEMVDLEDRPSIELLDGDTYKESPRLSTGQRCTTILPLLLLQNARPLLIDQPEDNLDNGFVYETIVKALRDVRGARQVIFVTHNPNIPVLGEAERIFVFGSDGQHASLRAVGDVDECKEHIEQILEGGREAFLQRKARYGH